MINTQTELNKGRQISIARLKHAFSESERFANHPFTAILLQEPDYLTIDQLLSKYTTWISVLSSETAKKVAGQIVSEEVIK